METLHIQPINRFFTQIVDGANRWNHLMAACFCQQRGVIAIAEIAIAVAEVDDLRWLAAAMAALGEIFMGREQILGWIVGGPVRFFIDNQA